MSKLRGEGPSPPFSIVPEVVPWGPLCNRDYLRSSFEESYLSLTNQSSAWGQAGWSKGGRGGAPARKISFVSLVAYGPKVSYSALAMGALQLLKPGRVVPNIGQALKLTMVHSFRILWYRTSFIIISLVVLNAHVPDMCKALACFQILDYGDTVIRSKDCT